MNKFKIALKICTNYFRSQIGYKSTGLFTDNLVIDGMNLKNAKIKNCVIHYCGGGFSMIDSEMNNCEFKFYGSAANTLTFIKAVFKDSPKALEKTFGVKLDTR